MPELSRTRLIERKATIVKNICGKHKYDLNNLVQGQMNAKGSGDRYIET